MAVAATAPSSADSTAPLCSLWPASPPLSSSTCSSTLDQDSRPVGPFLPCHCRVSHSTSRCLARPCFGGPTLVCTVVVVVVADTNVVVVVVDRSIDASFDSYCC